MVTAMSEEQFKAALPAKVKKSVNSELMKQINTTLKDPETYEQFRENLLSYANVMKDGRFKVSNYIDAVKYVSYKLQGRTNTDAYSMTFPDKIQRFAQQGVSKKDMASYITAYNKSKLVNLIMEQSIIPSWVLNQDLYQKALNTQAELMTTARSEKVRSDAANSILTHLKQPETQKFELDIGVKKDSTIESLKSTMREMAEVQREMLQSGAMDAQQMAHSELSVIDGELADDDN